MKELRGLLKNKYYNENTLSILQIALFSCDENSLLEINLVNESEKIVYGVILKVVAYNANKEVIKENIITLKELNLLFKQAYLTSLEMPKDTEYGYVYIQTIVFDNLVADHTIYTAHFASYNHVSLTIMQFLCNSTNIDLNANMIVKKASDEVVTNAKPITTEPIIESQKSKTIENKQVQSISKREVAFRWISYIFLAAIEILLSLSIAIGIRLDFSFFISILYYVVFILFAALSNINLKSKTFKIVLFVILVTFITCFTFLGGY